MKRLLVLSVLFTFFLVACSPEGITQSPTTEVSSSATPEPTETLTPTQVPTATITPMPQACIQLLTPENGITLPDLADTEKVTFSWESLEGAAIYRVEVIIPVGQVVTFDFEETSRDIYMQNIQLPGQYNWQVTALDTNGAELCGSDTFSFTKP